MKLHTALLSKATLALLGFSKLVHVTPAEYLWADQHTLLKHTCTDIDTGADSHTQMYKLVQYTWLRLFF